MDRTIWKYTLSLVDYVDIEMPTGARILSVGIQNEQICLWALVDPEKTAAKYRFRIAGTGHPIGKEAENWDFVGTVIMMNGALVFHVFHLCCII